MQLATIVGRDAHDDASRHQVHVTPPKRTQLAETKSGAQSGEDHRCPRRGIPTCSTDESCLIARLEEVELG